MNRLEVHVIFIHIRSDQQLSRIFPSLQKNNTFTQDHIVFFFMLVISKVFFVFTIFNTNAHYSRNKVTLQVLF